MWVFTTRGFYSVVEKYEDRGDGMVTVRARNEEDIRALADLIDAEPFQLDSWTDYEWRLRCSKDDWATALMLMADEIGYTNFKNEVRDVQGEARASVYSRVWSVLLGLERSGRFSKKSKPVKLKRKKAA